jgi:hypothetical protein
MKRLALVLLMVGCSDSPTNPSAAAVWPVSTSSVAGTSIVAAETERDSGQSPVVWLNVNCANAGTSGGGGGQAIVRDLRAPFDVPFVSTDLYPPSNASVPWAATTDGTGIQVRDAAAAALAGLLRAADSVRLSYSVGGALASYSWDTRAIGVALDSLRSVCDWP